MRGVFRIQAQGLTGLVDVGGSRHVGRTANVSGYFSFGQQ